MKQADLVQHLEAHGCYLELPAAGYATPLHTEIFAGSRVAMRPGTRIDANHQDVMRSIRSRSQFPNTTGRQFVPQSAANLTK